MTAASVIAKAAGIAPRTKRFIIRDEYGIPCDGGRTETVLAALGRSDLTPTLTARIHTVAYAIRKSLTTGRMDPATANRLTAYTPYQVCAVVARVADLCPEETIGGICDGWLIAHYADI